MREQQHLPCLTVWQYPSCLLTFTHAFIHFCEKVFKLKLKLLFMYLKMVLKHNTWVNQYYCWNSRWQTQIKLTSALQSDIHTHTTRIKRQNDAQNQHNKLNTAGLSAKLLEACGCLSVLAHKHTFGSKNMCSQTAIQLYKWWHAYSVWICAWSSLHRLYNLMPFRIHRAACFPITLPC